MLLYRDGATRSGLICAAFETLDRLQIDQEVDVFHSVKSIRNTRPQLVPNVVCILFNYETWQLDKSCYGTLSPYVN